MKTAIIAAAKGYTVNDVKPWTESLKKSGFDGSKFVILYEPSDEIAEYFKENDFNVLIGTDDGMTHIATQRFRDYSNLLSSEHGKDIDLVIHTDIRDVVFQKDPGKWLKDNIGSYHLIASGEAVAYRHEDWNGDGVQSHYGKEVFDELIDEETLCSGIIAGRREAFTKLCQTVYELAFFSNDPSGFADQHFYNVAIRKVFSDITKVVSSDDDWTVNCGTTIAIPHNSPDWSTGPRTVYNSYERFRKGSYVENMIHPVPTLKDGFAVNQDNEKYCIVHQYDRYEPWKEVFVGATKDVTLVTALYDLKREEWDGFNRRYDDYKKWLSELLTFDAPMVIYVDKDDKGFVEECRKDKKDKTVIVAMSFEEFETYKKHGDSIKDLMKSEKFIADQSVPNHPQISNPSYNILMHEKMQFVKRSIEKDYFGTDHYMWIDAGVFHMSNRQDLLGKKFPKRNFDNNKINFICLEIPNNEEIQNLEKFFKGHNVKIIGTSWCGHKDAILKFEKTYSSLLSESIENGLMDQDQSFLTVSYLRNPDICELYKGSWQDAVNFWA